MRYRVVSAPPSRVGRASAVRRYSGAPGDRLASPGSLAREIGRSRGAKGRDPPASRSTAGWAARGGSATAVAWLERDIPGKEPERSELSRLPFTLGRNESCDYQIMSSRVSREHAEIVREGGVLIVRDL